MKNKNRSFDKALIPAAIAAFKNAWAPYVGPPCGAAIRVADGAVHAGASFENAGFVHGIEALETALGQALIHHHPQSHDDILPQITEVVLCAKDSEAVRSCVPGPTALAWLKMMTDHNLSVTYITAEGEVLKQESYQDFLAPQSVLPFERDEFYRYLQARQQDATRSAVFATAPLSRLFDVRLGALDIWSRYAVGAMVKSNSGALYYGCNAEPAGNKAFHAEAMALAAMVTKEGGKARAEEITILTAGAPGMPCGGCRQNINELATDKTEIIGMNIEGKTMRHRHKDLLPYDFGPASLAGGREGL